MKGEGGSDIENEAALAGQSFGIAGARQFALEGEDGRRWRIMTWAPDTEPPDGGFPVLYVLDANAVFATVVEMVRFQCRGKDPLIPVAVIGIGYETDFPLDATRRYYDYTVYASPDELPRTKEPRQWPENGGADAFLAFLESEVKPFAARQFPVHPQRQALFGHSLGGFLALYAFLSRREAFQVYGACSPSVWWKDDYLLKWALRLEAEQEKEANGVETMGLLLAVGTKELPDMIEGARRMHDHLAAAMLPGLVLRFRELEGEAHCSAVFPALGTWYRFASGMWGYPGDF
ncbi:Ferri-bacillibactin esterase BesA [compost metagenome]